MKYVIAALVSVFALALTGCNTIVGAGRDIESAGDAIEDTARDVRN